MLLGDYLGVVRRNPPQGDFPCAEFVAGWVVANGFADPLAPLRSMSRTHRLRAKARHGVVGLARTGMEAIGLSALEQNAQSQEGDIAVIMRATYDDTQACAIYGNAGRWITLGAHGFDAGPVPLVYVAWRLRHG